MLNISIETGGEYWVSGSRKVKKDRLYKVNQGVEVDEDLKVAYLKIINNQ
ncbi:MAG: hypothetical protein ACI8XB_002958 [Patiriisocius sp.]|jgi:hypothetical protein